MTIGATIVPLDDTTDGALDAILKREPDSLFFATSGYRALLRRHLGRRVAVEDHSVAALDGSGQPIAALPLIAATHPEHGTVLNSLPYFGSNGGVVPNSAHPDVRESLLARVHQTALDTGARATTVVCSPFERDLGAYERAFPGALRDERLGQLSPLPARGRLWTDDASLRDALMDACHQKTRNMVRKAWKHGVEVARDESPDAMAFLERTHRDNMDAIGGTPKDPEFFEDLSSCLARGDEWRLYVARHEGEPVAALLILVFGHVAEYFTPVVVSGARTMQPLSAIIHAAMADAARDGRRWWNWGGTWRTQDGVYRFKSRWGTEDHPYHYFTVLHDPSLLSLPRAELPRAWPGFFAYPWDGADALDPGVRVTSRPESHTQAP